MTILNDGGDEAFFLGLGEESETGVVDGGVFISDVAFVEFDPL